MERTIVPTLQAPIPEDEPLLKRHREMVRELLATRFDPGWQEPDSAMAAYERHNEAVRRAVPPDRLLESAPGGRLGAAVRGARRARAAGAVPAREHDRRLPRSPGPRRSAVSTPAAPGAERPAAEAERGGGSSQRAREIGARLAEVLQAPLTAGLKRLSSGASRETFAFATDGPRRARAPDRTGAASSLRPCRRRRRCCGGRGGRRAGAAGHRARRDDAVLGPSWIVAGGARRHERPARDPRGRRGARRARSCIDGIAAALAAVHRMPADPAARARDR